MLDQPGEFMPHGQRGFDAWIAVLESLQICAAYRTGVDTHEKLIIAANGVRQLLDSNIARGVVDNRLHG
jgi:hypothetical protein